MKILSLLKLIKEVSKFTVGAIFERFDAIVEFSAFHDFISFERKGKNKIKKVENHKIKVAIEVDMV